jgi:hypothetical protein
MQPALPKLTVTELAIAEKVGRFLIPTMRTMVAAVRTERDNTMAKFCGEFAALQKARECLPDSASPMARHELDARMLELAGAFVDAQNKA